MVVYGVSHRQIATRYMAEYRRIDFLSYCFFHSFPSLSKSLPSANIASGYSAAHWRMDILSHATGCWWHRL